MEISEENYVKLMQKGNDKAFQYFIERDGWIIKSMICQKMALFKDEQEDCMNEAFLAIWQNVRKYDAEKASFTTWAAAVTRYQILKYLRKLKNSSFYEDLGNPEVLETAGADDIQPQILHYDEKEEFRLLLKGLSPRDQEIFMELFWEELSHDEICEHNNMKKDILYNRISRGKKKLRLTLFEGGRKYE